MKTILITGATRGLGLAFAKALVRDPDVSLVLAVRDLDAGKRVAQHLGPNAEAIELDMSQTASIRQLSNAWDRPLHGLINNAGLQNVSGTEMSEDGIEMTLAVNHLGPLQLTYGLLRWLDKGQVMGIGSGTHNPNDKGATRFGFRGGRFTSVEALARGDVDAETERQAGFDRYATSKLLAMATSMELARRFPDTVFTCLDPGLMPGTGLARQAPPLVRMAWSHVLPLLVPLMSGASTPERSAAVGSRLLLEPGFAKTGVVYDHKGHASDRVWDKVMDNEFGRTALDQSLDFLSKTGALPSESLRAVP